MPGVRVQPRLTAIHNEALANEIQLKFASLE
jgi:hypothetical protein